MTIEDVRARVAQIDAVADLVETAHKEEHRLHLDVLEAIAGGATNGAELAHEALATRHLNLDRQYSVKEEHDLNFASEAR